MILRKKQTKKCAPGKLKKRKVPNKTALRRKCDKLVGAMCRAIGRCEICGETQYLQWCHFVTRARIHLRYEPLNYACLCAGCHFHGHQNPGWLVNQWIAMKGLKQVEWLISESDRIEPVREDFYNFVLNNLKKED